MPRYKVTYIKEYEVNADSRNDALGISDQGFTNDIREMLSEGGKNKISYLFNFKIEKIEKKGILKRKIEENKE